jgi:hypothetical protein
VRKHEDILQGIAGTINCNGDSAFKDERSENVLSQNVRGVYLFEYLHTILLRIEIDLTIAVTPQSSRIEEFG